MSTTVERNNPKIFPKNEGKINSRGINGTTKSTRDQVIIAEWVRKNSKASKSSPPVPPKPRQAKFTGIKAIFERNVPNFQMNDSISNTNFHK